MSDNTRAAETSTFTYAVIMEWARGRDRWATERWEAKGVIRDPIAASDEARVIHADELLRQVLFPGIPLRLEPQEAEGYYLNITCQEPKIFVLWRMDGDVARPERITASYTEGTGWADSGENVDSVLLPADLLPYLADFVAAHYRPEPKRKPRYASSKDKGVASRR